MNLISGLAVDVELDSFYLATLQIQIVIFYCYYHVYMLAAYNYDVYLYEWSIF